MQQFETPQSSDQLTPEEAREVMLLWEERQQSSGLPTIRDLAETLKISPEQTGLLLGEVRARKQVSAPTPMERKVDNEKRVLYGGLAAAVCVMALVVFGGLMMQRPGGSSSGIGVATPVRATAYPSKPIYTPSPNIGVNPPAKVTDGSVPDAPRIPAATTRVSASGTK